MYSHTDSFHNVFIYVLALGHLGVPFIPSIPSQENISQKNKDISRCLLLVDYDYVTWVQALNLTNIRNI